MFDVTVSEHVFAKAHRLFGDERSVSGTPSEYDFVGGPLSAAILEFRHFEELPEAVGPGVRSLTVVDPFFGAVVFVGVLVGTNAVEIADFDDDPYYWSMIDPT